MQCAAHVPWLLYHTDLKFLSDCIFVVYKVNKICVEIYRKYCVALNVLIQVLYCIGNFRFPANPKLWPLSKYILLDANYCELHHLHVTKATTWEEYNTSCVSNHQVARAILTWFWKLAHYFSHHLGPLILIIWIFKRQSQLMAHGNLKWPTVLSIKGQLCH